MAVNGLILKKADRTAETVRVVMTGKYPYSNSEHHSLSIVKYALVFISTFRTHCAAFIGMTNGRFTETPAKVKNITQTNPKNDTTVLSGAKERGVDVPSLDRSYFSRLQPISFLFFNPSSSHVG